MDMDGQSELWAGMQFVHAIDSGETFFTNDAQRTLTGRQRDGRQFRVSAETIDETRRPNKLHKNKNICRWGCERCRPVNFRSAAKIECER